MFVYRVAGLSTERFMTSAWVGQFMLEQTAVRRWVKRAQAGDAAAFEQILLLNERMVLRTAQRLLGNDEDAKDAAQEVFLRLHTKLGSFREEADLQPWLYRMTVNICIDIQRRRRLPIEDSIDLVCERPDPETQFLGSQHRELVKRALARLPERERAAIVLRDLEGCSTAEVAAILGSSESTVRSQISTGHNKIRTFLAKHLGRTR